MDRIPKLPGGCKSLSETVRVIGLDGAQFLMTVASARTFAADHRAELVHIATGKERIFKLVDDAARGGPQGQKQGAEL